MTTGATVPNPVLREIFERHEVLDSQGVAVPLQENVTAEHAYALYRAVLAHRPRRVLEVGMAYGVTSLAILTALDEVGEAGTLTTVDPYQSRDWGSIGLLNVRRADLAERLTLIEEPDFLALPKLLAEGTQVDFAYIDGWHNFEYVLLDFFYTDKMLEPGAIVGFNDCDWLPVRAALRFVQRHRNYERVDVGLEPVYGDRFGWTRAVRRLDQRLTGSRVTEDRRIGALLGRRREDQYFKKLSSREPPHGFWARV
jgi:predicted O-methyltransferase YrrM